MPADFHFLQPLWFVALLPLAFAIWLLLRVMVRSDVWRKVIDPRWIGILMDGEASRPARWPLVLLGVGGVLAILGLANPAWERLPQPVYESQQARVFVLDLSLSMYSPDLKPDRLTRARFKLRDILARPWEGQSALVTFAGDAFTVTPLTRDGETIESLLSALSPAVMPVQGNRLDLGINKAVSLMQQAGALEGQIIVLADDSNGEEADEAARSAHAAGYPVSVIGIGTEAGAPIPNGRGGFIQDASGRVVRPVLSDARLEAVATAGSGNYVRMAQNGADIDEVLTPGNGGDATAAEDGFKSERWKEMGPWLVPVLALFAALAFRRGWLLSCAAVGLLFSPPQAKALEWADFWSTPDQQAAAALKSGNYDRALSKAQDASLRGSAAYRSGDYPGAAKDFSRVESADALYNKGNALALQGQYQSALDAYDRALSLDPGMEDASFNRQLIQNVLNKQPPQQQEEDASSGDGDGQDKQEQNQSDPGAQDGQNPQENPQSGEGQGDQDAQSEQGGEDQSQEGEKNGGGATPEQNEADAEEGNKPEAAAGGESASSAASEEEMAAEQWLRRIEDDPGELMRRKFQYEYQKRERGRSGETGTPW